MQIITDRKIIVKDEKSSSACGCSGFDGNGKPQNSAETKMFQDWLDVKYPTWNNGGKLNKGGGYGKYPFGTQTNNAWKNYGSEFSSSRASLMGNLSSMGALGVSTGDNSSSGSSSKEPSQEEKVKMAKVGKVWNKTKGWVADQGGALAILEKGKGIFDTIKGIFGGSSSPSYSSPDQSYPQGSSMPIEQPKEGMSKTAKIAIGVGAGLLLVTLIVIAVKKNKK